MVIRDIAILFGYQVDRNSEQRTETSIKNLKAMATKLLGAIGVGFSLVKVNAIAEEFSVINNQISNATKGMEEQEAVQQKILRAANAARVAYADTAKFVSNLVQENKNLFPSVDEAAEFAEMTTKLFKTAGKSNQEVATLQEAINKSFAKGIVDSETINQLYEKAPEAINLIADSLGVASSELAQMVSDGKIGLETLKTAFTSNADLINTNFGNVNMTVSDAMLNIRNQWGLFVDGLNSSLGITDTIGRVMVRTFNSVMEVLKKLQSWVERLSKAVGGAENLFKLLAISAAAVFVALNAKNILLFLKGVGTLLGGINLKILAIIAVIIVIALIVEDFINFMRGNDSVIGSLLEKAGVDTEKVRETIIAAWQAIRDFLSGVWEKIKAIATDVWGKLKDFWADNGDEIKESLLAVWNAIRDVLIPLWEALKAVAMAEFNALKAFWDRWGDKIKATFSILWDYLGDLVMSFFKVIKGLAEFIAGVFTGDWNRAWEGIKSVFIGIWDAISAALQAIWGIIWTFIGDTVTNIKNKIVDTFTNIKESIVTTVTGIKDAIVEGFNKAIDWIKSLPEQAIQWGKDIILGIIDGIKGAIGGVADAAKGIGDTIKSFLGFSVPEKGPLSEFESWMPDFMQGMAQGIQNSKGLVTDAVKALVGDMSILVQGAVANGGTAQALAAGVSNRSMTQNVNIANTFNGEAAIQKNTSKAMNSAASDATSQMARGLAYAR